MEEAEQLIFVSLETAKYDKYEVYEVRFSWQSFWSLLGILVDQSGKHYSILEEHAPFLKVKRIGS
jgi:hypothetical protein